MKAAIALLILLSLSACHEKAPGKGNEPTYSGNGKGERDAQIIEACAWKAYDAYRADPGVNGDALFILCLDYNGVWSI